MEEINKYENGLSLGEFSFRLELDEFGSDGKYTRIAQEQLRETPEVVSASILKFKQLIKEEEKEKNINFPINDEARLKNFLRPCKYYPESAMEKMKKFYQFKLKHKYYDNLLPSLETDAFKQNIVTILPLRNINGERIVLVQAGVKWDTSTCSLESIFRSIMLCTEVGRAEPRTQVCGVHVLLDMEGLSFSHVYQFTPAFAKHVVDWVQDCVPVRIKGIHILNNPFIFNIIFALFKPFLRQKLQKRIIFHGRNFDGLHQHVDKASLPLRFNGTADIELDKGMELNAYLREFDYLYEQNLQYGYPKNINKSK